MEQVVTNFAIAVIVLIITILLVWIVAILKKQHVRLDIVAEYEFVRYENIERIELLKATLIQTIPNSLAEQKILGQLEDLELTSEQWSTIPGALNSKEQKKVFSVYLMRLNVRSYWLKAIAFEAGFT